MSKITVVQPADGPICDFCSEQPVKWRYPARDVRPIEAVSIPGLLVQTSVGDWAACDKCHALIEADDRDGLAWRTLATGPIITDPELVLSMTKGLQAAFFDARTGPAVRHE